MMLSRGRDSGLAWLAVIGAFISTLIYAGMTRSFGTLYLVMLERFHAGQVSTSWVGALNLLMIGLGGLLSAWLCNTFSHRLVGFGGGLIVIIGLILTAFATTIAQVYVWYGVVGGAGMSLVYTASFLVVDRNFDRLKTTAMALAYTGSGTGAFIFPPILETVQDKYGYTACVLCLAASSLLLLPNIILFRLPGEPVIPDWQMIFHGAHLSATAPLPNSSDLPEPITDHQSVTDTSEGNHRSSTESTGLIHKPSLDDSQGPLSNANEPNEHQAEKAFWDWSLLRDLGVLAFLLQNITVQAFVSFGSQYTPAFAIEQGVDSLKASLLLSATGISGLVIPLLVSILADLPSLRDYMVYIVNVCVAAGGFLQLCAPFCYGYPLLMFVFFMKSGLVGVFLTQRATLSGKVGVVKRTAAVLGLALIAECGGTLIGRLSGGVFKENVGSYDPGFYLTGIMVLVGSFIFHLAFMVDTKQKRNRDSTPQTTETEI